MSVAISFEIASLRQVRLGEVYSEQSRTARNDKSVSVDQSCNKYYIGFDFNTFCVIILPNPVKSMIWFGYFEIWKLLIKKEVTYGLGNVLSFQSGKKRKGENEMWQWFLTLLAKLRIVTIRSASRDPDFTEAALSRGREKTGMTIDQMQDESAKIARQLTMLTPQLNQARNSLGVAARKRDQYLTQASRYKNEGNEDGYSETMSGARTAQAEYKQYEEMVKQLEENISGIQQSNEAIETMVVKAQHDLNLRESTDAVTVALARLALVMESVNTSKQTAFNLSQKPDTTQAFANKIAQEVQGNLAEAKQRGKVIDLRIATKVGGTEPSLSAEGDADLFSRAKELGLTSLIEEPSAAPGTETGETKKLHESGER